MPQLASRLNQFATNLSQRPEAASSPHQQLQWLYDNMVDGASQQARRIGGYLQNCWDHRRDADASQIATDAAAAFGRKAIRQGLASWILDAPVKAERTLMSVPTGAASSYLRQICSK